MMKRFFIPAFLLLSFQLFAQPALDFYDKHWSEVHKLELKSLPKSALQVVDTIYHRATIDGNYVQLTKAMIFQSKFVAAMKEDHELLIVDMFRREIATSRPPQKNLLQNMLATIYWEYYKKNRWQFYQRTRTEKKVNELDFRTWDLHTLFHEIDTYFQRSLTNADYLQDIRINKIDEILVKFHGSEIYRSTLYDFLAQNALEFYRTSESRLAEPTNKFELRSTDLFMDYRLPIDPQFQDSLSLEYRAISLYQKLLKFHEQQKDTAAFVLLSLDRLKFLKRESNLDNKQELFLEALDDLESQFPHPECNALINYEIADYHYDKGTEYDAIVNSEVQFSKKIALEICDHVIHNFPESNGAEKCRKLRERILIPVLRLTAERHIPSQKHTRVLIRYSNIEHLKFSLYKVTQDQKVQFRKQRTDSTIFSHIARLDAAEEFTVELLNLGDYQLHSTECIIPPLDHGEYLIVAQIPGEQKIFAYEFVQVTDLVLAKTLLDKRQRYQVLDRNNGKPIAMAKILFFNRRNTDQLEKYLLTDEMGFAYLNRRKDYSNYFVQVTTSTDRAYFGNIYIPGMYNSYKDKEIELLQVKPFVFTDRSIYRPGQAVHFKGILTQQAGGDISVVPNEFVEIYLNDPNDEELAMLRLKTNEYGSVSGEFKIPNGGLTGRYNISIEEDYKEDSNFYDKIMGDFIYNEQYFNVEEYKRPRFEVIIDANKTTPQLHDTITVAGKTLAFMGAPISDAKVVYKVTRQVRYPSWKYWSFSRNYYTSDAREIAFGDTITNENGAFSFTFPAIPDEQISKEEYPIFEYSIDVAITDINGETRSEASTIRVGYHTMEISIEHEDDIREKVEKLVTIHPKNLNGQEVETQGKLMVFRPKSDRRLLRNRPWEAPDLPLISEEDFIKYFPYDSYRDENGPEKDENRILVFETEFNTSDSNSVRLPIDNSWKSGTFFIEVIGEDPAQIPAIGKSKFTLQDKDENFIPRDRSVFHRIDKTSYRPGDNVQFTIGSASPDVSITIDIEKGDKVVDTRIIRLSNDMETITVPVEEADLGGFVIKYHLVNFNDHKTNTAYIDVLVAQRKIEIETSTFRDKLQPGQEETWSFNIKGTEGTNLHAEVLASMYDASLDQFKPHAWNFNPNPKSRYFGKSHTDFGRCFDNARFSVRNIPNLPRTSQQQYDRLNWFGFSIDNNRYVNRQYLNNLYFSYYDTLKIKSKVSISHDPTRQQGYIYGRVVTDEGEALPGVNVIVEGTTNGTVSDNEGNYVIKVDKGSRLVFSSVGFASISVRVKQENTIDIEMMSDVTALNEIVVVAYRAQRKSNLTGAIVEVADAEEIEIDLDIEMFSETVIEEVYFEEELAEKVVTVSGSDGNNYQLKIRGVSSIDGNANPLYVVDGVIVDNSQLNENDLASISVLKGESATAIYGARGANGVILITTKSGQKRLDEELAKVRIRKKLDETAFFYPHLKTNEDGNVSFTFTTPEALSRWKLQLFAHTKELISSINTFQAITTKDLMIIPNTPRFLRQGDEVVISAKISNLTNTTLEGIVGLHLSNPFNGDNVNEAFSNTTRNADFSVGARGNAVVSWRLKIPEDTDIIQYKIVAKAGDYSDGEQNVIPILTNRMLVTESLPIQVKSRVSKTFQLEKLMTNESKTLQHHKLTLEVTSNPTWFVLQALPYLMEFPHECAEQTFARYYANALGLHIINSNPEIKKVFESWGADGSSMSKLVENDELKSILIQETPWLSDAQSETEQKQNIAKLFADDKLKESLQSAIDKLEQSQMSNGGFSWFPGSDYPNRYITQHVISGLAHLHHLEVAYHSLKADYILKKGIIFMDSEIEGDYNKLLKWVKELAKDEKSAKDYLSERHINDLQIQYLYAHSFYNDSIVNKNSRKAYKFYLNQSAEYWQEFGLSSQGMIALIHSRAGNFRVAREIIASLKENSVTNEHLGTYWKQNRQSWRWSQAPIETQAMLIEAISEIDAADSTISESDKLETIDNMKLWLLKNKQTNRWPTTKSTTEAIYALLLSGSEWLMVKEQVKIQVGDHDIKPSDQPEAGTGYYKTSWSADEINTKMGEVSMTKESKGIAWGGLYWQYFEDLDKISSAETPLSLSKKVFIVSNTSQGQLLTEVDDTTKLKLGELIRVRIELRSDREMEFIHMKDMRAAGFEPLNILSEYKWQDRLGYYESTKDASTNFFFDRIPKGVYIFEYDLRVNNSGYFSNGITTIESMYAPEFKSHSEGIRILVE